jgi:hypothetical protein
MFDFQNERWTVQFLLEMTLAVGTGGSRQAVVARTRSHLGRKLNMQRLAKSFGTITNKE